MLSQNQKQTIRSSRNVVFSALVIIEAITLYNWIVRPHVNYLRAAQIYESVANKLAKKNQIISNNVTIRRKEHKELKERFEHIHLKLFDPVKAKEFFSDIQAMAEETNCIIYSLNFSPTDSALDTGQEVSSHITANHVLLSAVGNYKNTVALINKLQDRPKQVWIDSISIEPISNNSEQLKCDITITIYVIHSKGEHSYD